MTSNGNSPKTLMEVITFFSDKSKAVEYLASRRWKDGVTCQCGSKNVTAITTRQIWQCKDCRRQFSVKVGTIFEDSPLPLGKWLTASWLLMNAKNGISSCEVARSLAVTQKTAWFMMHRIREAMANGSFEKLKGTVEADETYIGGLDKNRHANKKRHIPGGSDKALVMGMVERGGNVVARVIVSTNETLMKREIRKHVEKESVLYTDELNSYNGLGREYYRATVNHSDKEYVRGHVHTNTVEGFWALLKRCYKGTYIHMDECHIDRYVSEQSLRYNLRKENDGTRFDRLVSQMFGVRLTWNELTGKLAAR